jgi:hypothetical protein
MFSGLGRSGETRTGKCLCSSSVSVYFSSPIWQISGCFPLQSGRICSTHPACELEEESVNPREEELDNCTHSSRLADIGNALLAQRKFSGVRFQVSGVGGNHAQAGFGFRVSGFRVRLTCAVVSRFVFRCGFQGSGSTDVYAVLSVRRQSRNLATATG